MNKIDCPNFEDCSAPLCPLDDSSIQNGIWYPDEEICRKREVPDWVKRQGAIVRARALADRYWSVDMLRAVKQVRKGIEGISPDQPLEQAKEAERKWIVEKQGGRVVAEKNQKVHRVIAKKKANLVSVGKTSHQEKGEQDEI